VLDFMQPQPARRQRVGLCRKAGLDEAGGQIHVRPQDAKIEQAKMAIRTIQSRLARDIATKPDTRIMLPWVSDELNRYSREPKRGST
jgi:hypothetical protein